MSTAKEADDTHEEVFALINKKASQQAAAEVKELNEKHSKEIAALNARQDHFCLSEIFSHSFF